MLRSAELIFKQRCVCLVFDVSQCHSEADACLNCLQGSWGAINMTGPWAAQATGYICSAASMWQQLQLHAVPGMQLLLDGYLAAATAAEGAVEPYPRGPAVDAVVLRWAQPGCAHVQLRLFEPPRCGQRHVEVLASPPAPALPLAEVTVAYSNSSVMLCAGSGCSRSQRVALVSGTRVLVVRLEWKDGTLTQQLRFTGDDLRESAPEDWVRHWC